MEVEACGCHEKGPQPGRGSQRRMPALAALTLLRKVNIQLTAGSCPSLRGSEATAAISALSEIMRFPRSLPSLGMTVRVGSGLLHALAGLALSGFARRRLRRGSRRSP